LNRGWVEAYERPRMDWVEANRFVAELGSAAREDLLRVLISSNVVRAHTIRQFHELGNKGMAELLILLEEQEWARQHIIEELSRGRD
jgi:hypothetical protein